MEPLFTAAQMREADRYATGELGIPEMVLMEHAALGLVGALERRFGKLLPDTRGVVLAGTGNNGGDALAAARILAQRGCSKLFVCLNGDEKTLSESAATQLRILGKVGIAWSHELTDELVLASDWVLDGLFGTGLSRPVTGEALDAITLVNRHKGSTWVVSADIPSGLSADTGTPQGAAVRASETVTFGFLKRGLVTGLSADYVGSLTLDPIQIPRLVPGVPTDTFLYGREDAVRSIPERPETAHKGLFGHVFVLAGPPDKQGAAALSALGALRAGAGLVTVVATEKELEGLRPRLLPDLMTAAWTPQFFTKHRPAVAVVGPGLGTGAAGWERLEEALSSDWSLVLDADALTVLSEKGAEARKLVAKRAAHKPILLTPHPKEAARLLGESTEGVQGDRYAACRELVSRYGALVVLKGKGTVVGGPGLPLLVVTAGNSALSVGGTGDVLTGILASLIAQGVKPERSLALGAFLHGRAAEIFVQRHGDEHSSQASEIAATLPQVFRELAGR